MTLQVALRNRFIYGWAGCSNRPPMSNSFGFGGHNSVLVFKAWEGYRKGVARQTMALDVRDGSLEIRSITQNDLNAVLGVYQQCEDFLALGPQPKASMAMVLQDIEISKRDGGVFCGIHNADGTMIGVLDFIPSGFEGDAHTASLSLLMISRPYRGQGIGQTVVRLFENEVRKDAQVTAIVSGVQVNNPQAVKFWQKNGYRIISGPELMPDQTTVFLLRKDL